MTNDTHQPVAVPTGQKAGEHPPAGVDFSAIHDFVDSGIDLVYFGDRPANRKKTE
jgi:hypothetical protein